MVESISFHNICYSTQYMSSNLKLKLEEEEELKKANVELNRWRDECYKMVKKMERVSMYMHPQLVLHGAW